MKITGVITVDELVAGYEKIFDLEEFQPNMNAVWDLSALDLKRIPVGDIRALPAAMRGLMAQRGDNYKAALVTTRSVDYQLLRMYFSLLNLISPGFRMRLFQKLDDAYGWLAE